MKTFLERATESQSDGHFAVSTRRAETGLSAAGEKGCTDLLTNHTYRAFEKSGHYPHFEEQALFDATLFESLKRTDVFHNHKNSSGPVASLARVGGISVACQYLFNGKTRFAYRSTFITGRPNHPRLTTRIDEKPKPGTLAAPDQEFHAQVLLATPPPGIRVVTYSSHIAFQRYKPSVE